MHFGPIALIVYALLSVGAIEMDPITFSQTAFDYIVIGGGTTGLSVAARLSDDAHIVVGIIEAGKHLEDDTILIPALGGSGVGNSTYDWLLSTVPQSQLGNRTLPLGRGKVLGGTSAMNLMQYTKASKREYDDWERLGNPGWNFEALQTFMKKAERWTPPEPQTIRKFVTDNHAPDHGSEGSIFTTANANYTDLIPEYLNSLENLSSVARNFAPTGGSPGGAMSVTLTINAQNRSRSYSTNGYYEPRSSRSNLVILTGAEVTKLELVSDSNGSLKATKAVYVTDSNDTYSASVSREIIISAGSVKTPQILELSGIGDSTCLRELGIPPLLDLPGVGNNLQDHIGVPISFLTWDNVTTYDALRDPSILPTLFQEYVTNRTGLLSGAPSTTAFLPLDKFMSAADIAKLKHDIDIDLKLVQGSSSTRTPISMQREWLEDNSVPQLEIAFLAGTTNPTVDVKARFYSFVVVCLHPFARGDVHIASNDGRSPPLIDPKYLKAPGDFDRRVLKHALRFGLNLALTEPLRSFTRSVASGPPFNATDELLETWIEENASSDLHPTGSAAMLPSELGGVVGPDLLVHGSTNVRIVDMSIWPLHLAAHPVATLYGIAEKGANLILAKTDSHCSARTNQSYR